MLDGLKIQLFQDGARIDDIKNAVQNSPLIRGFTTNPTLMRAAGVTDYAAFAQEAIEVAGDLSISFEVFSDDFEEMEREARIIKSWGGNTCVKIPITNTKGASSVPLIERLSGDGISCNVTAIFTTRQVAETAAVLVAEVPSIVSVFAGRVADTGVDPMPLMTETVGILADNDGAQALWASPRELLNVFQADAVGCHIITATPDLLAKIKSVGKDHEVFSLETVQMFYNDAAACGYKL